MVAKRSQNKTQGATPKPQKKKKSKTTKTITKRPQNKTPKAQKKKKTRSIVELFNIMENENPLSKIILKIPQNPDVLAIKNACTSAQVSLQMLQNESRYELVGNGQVLVKTKALNPKVARAKLYEMVLNKFRKYCVILEKKPINLDSFIKITSLNKQFLFDNNKIIESKILEDKKDKKRKKEKEPEQRISEMNPGYQMLLKMGWSGKGLGINEQGIVDPVKLKEKTILTKSIEDLSPVKKVFFNYRQSNCTLPLIFDMSLDISQRAELHSLAKSCRLISRSINLDGRRLLTVYKKVKDRAIVDRLIRNGGENEQYKLHIPTKFKDLFENYESLKN